MANQGTHFSLDTLLAVIQLLMARGGNKLHLITGSPMGTTAQMHQELPDSLAVALDKRRGNGLGMALERLP